jgi:hypothetical protein
LECQPRRARGPSIFTRPHIPVDPGGDKAASNRRAQQEMIDAQSGVAGERIPEMRRLVPRIFPI